MKTIKAHPDFVSLSEEEIIKALDAYEAEFDGEEGDEDLTPEDPIVAEVARLIGEYTARFDAYCEEGDELPADVLDYEPEVPIERVAFEIFMDALHDALQDEDEE